MNLYRLYEKEKDFSDRKEPLISFKCEDEQEAKEQFKTWLSFSGLRNGFYFVYNADENTCFKFKY